MTGGRDRWRTIIEMTPDEIADLVHLRRARDLIDRDYAHPLDVPSMARAALMSPAHFSRKFRAAYGETPYAYLMTRRIERAKAFLRRGCRSPIPASPSDARPLARSARASPRSWGSRRRSTDPTTTACSRPSPPV